MKVQNSRAVHGGKCSPGKIGKKPGLPWTASNVFMVEKENTEYSKKK